MVVPSPLSNARRRDVTRYSSAVRRFGVAPAALILALSFTGFAASGAKQGGLHGIVMKGPMPVCRTDSCDVPAKGLVLKFSRNGRVRTQVRTNDKGRYSVTLRPGRYGVTTPHLRPGQELTPHFVSVPRVRSARVDFHLDIGIP
jgi:hypothetical protein